MIVNYDSHDLIIFIELYRLKVIITHKLICHALEKERAAYNVRLKQKKAPNSKINIIKQTEFILCGKLLALDCKLDNVNCRLHCYASSWWQVTVFMSALMNHSLN